MLDFSKVACIAADEVLVVLRLVTERRADADTEPDIRSYRPRPVAMRQKRRSAGIAAIGSISGAIERRRVVPAFLNLIERSESYRQRNLLPWAGRSCQPG